MIARPPRRRRIRGLLVLATALTVAGCGGDDGALPAITTTAERTVPASVDATVADTEEATSVATDASSAAPEPTSAATDAGDPGRVVVLSEEFMLADVMALGIRPVASTASVPEVGFQGMGDTDTTGIDVLSMTSLNLEQVAALEPDVVITLQFWVDQIGADQLGGLAEVIAVPDGLSIPERLAFLGDALGRPTQAEAVVEDLRAAEAAAAETVPDDCAVSLAAIYPGPSPAVFVAGPWELPTSVLATGCALDPDPSVAAPDGNGRVYLSLEQLGLLDAPMIVLLQSTTVPGEEEAVEQITANPLWAQLPAVQADRVVTFDRLGYPGAAGQIRFLAEFAALFP